MELAHKRDAEHPEDALPIYQDQVARLIAQMGKQAYQQAVGLLREVSEVMTRLGREEELPPTWRRCVPPTSASATSSSCSTPRGGDAPSRAALRCAGPRPA